MDLSDFVALAAVTLLGSLVQAAFGFGFAILAAPLFLVVMDSAGAVPTLAVLNLAVSVAVAAYTWRQAPRQLLLRLCAGSLVGFPIGLALFRIADVAQLKVATGTVIMAFALWLFVRELGVRPRSKEGARVETSIGWALSMGALSGAMGAALAMPGPVAMLYLAAVRLSKDQSRALSLAFFSFVYGAVCLLHALNASLSAQHVALAAKLMLAVLLGAAAGHRLARHISEDRFRVLILAILFVAGLYAVASA